MTTTLPNPLTTCERARDELEARMATLGCSIPEMARRINVAPGTLYRFLHDPDYEPKRADIRQALGLPLQTSGPVRAQVDHPEAFYRGDARKCKRSECPVWFVSDDARRRYCCDECRRLYWNRRRRR